MKYLDDGSVRALDKVMTRVQLMPVSPDKPAPFTAGVTRRTVWVKPTSATINANGYYPAKFVYRSSSTTWVDYSSGTCWLESSFVPSTSNTYECSVTHKHTDNLAVCRMVSHGVSITEIRNTDGTQINAAPSSLQFNKTTGIQTTGTSGTSTITGIAAASTQMGMVNLTTNQYLGAGTKRIYEGYIYPDGAQSPSRSGWTLYLVPHKPAAAQSYFGYSIGGNYSTTAISYAWTGFVGGASDDSCAVIASLGGVTSQLPFNVTALVGSDSPSGPIFILGNNNLGAAVPRYCVLVNNGGVLNSNKLYVGLTRDFATGEVPKVFGGIVYDYVAASPPPPSPPGSYTTQSVIGSVTVTENTNVRVSNSGIANTLTIPSAATAGAGAWIYIQDEGGTAGTANISVVRSGSDTINGSTTAVVAVSTNYGSRTLTSNGTNAWTMS